MVVRRQFTHNGIEEFKHLLSKEVWNDVYNCLDVNSFLEAFLGAFLHCFNIAFPYKRVNLRARSNKRWLSKELIVPSKRMQTLNNPKRTFTLTRVYKKVLREAKKRGNGRYVVESMDRMKAMWRLINREIGKAPENDEKLELRIGNKLISNPNEITDN